LAREFSMKDKILGMRISRERKKIVEAAQAKYIEKVLRRFNMVDAKSVNLPLGGHFRLLKAQELKTYDEKALMSKVPYASAVSSLMYADL